MSASQYDTELLKTMLTSFILYITATVTSTDATMPVINEAQSYWIPQNTIIKSHFVHTY